MEVICENCSTEFEKLTAEVNRTKSNLCSRQCNAKLQQKKSMDNFYNNVKVVEGCWEWQGSRDIDGYGQKRYEGKNQRAHRVSYMISIGEVGSLFVLHHCDNPKCVNPDHLWLGSHQDNMDDMVKKGRKLKINKAQGILVM